MKITDHSLENPLHFLKKSLVMAHEIIHEKDGIISEKNTALEQKDHLIEQKDQAIAALELRVAKLLFERYARRTEAFAHPQQDSLFDEALIAPEDIDVVEAAEQAIQVEAFARKKSGRRPLPACLPREEIVHDLPEADKFCTCGCALTPIGSDRSEQLDIIPAQFKVLVHVRMKYACKPCEGHIKIAPVPVMPMAKSIAAPSLLAHVLVCKYMDHLPLYRQESILQRSGVDIARSTLSHWVIQCAALLKPLVRLMHDKIQHYDIAYADETTLQVLKEPGRAVESTSYLWYFAGGVKRCVVYEYQPTRAGKVAQAFFSGYKGYLHCDGYAGYEALFSDDRILGVGCWAHARRKFAEIAKSNKKHPGFALEVINLLQKVYRLEKIAKAEQHSLEQVHTMRNTRAKEILEDLKTRLEHKIHQAPPGSPIYKAIQYTLNQWGKLMNYLKDPRLDIDNNASERAIKHFAVGRKNWLFSDTAVGAEAGAIIYSLLETCRAHQVEPFAYFTAVLTAIPSATTPDALEALLPFNYQRSLTASTTA